MCDVSLNSLNAYVDKLSSLCQQYGLAYDDDVYLKCLKHLNLVIEANQSINLTRITDYDEAIVLHILDSLLLAPYVDKAPGESLLDFGTGAGFPGLPLAVATQRYTILLDSVGKKVKAVSRFIDELCLSNVSAYHIRVEDYAVDHRSSVSCVVARAVAELPVLIEYAAPLLSQGGYLVLSKGNPTSVELDRGLIAAKMCGFHLIENDSLDLPFDLGHRSILVYEKSSKPSVKLPRKAGTAKKSPLA